MKYKFMIPFSTKLLECCIILAISLSLTAFGEYDKIRKKENPDIVSSEDRQVKRLFFYHSLQVRLTEEISRHVKLSSDTEIESLEWVGQDTNCLRIRVQYKEAPEDEYRHKEDYFFFLGADDDIQVLYADYPGKSYDNMDKDRYVWSGCDFNAHFEDVTFDGHDDLILFLGHSGVHGTCIYAAYVYENGSYRYEPSFEEIPNYEADVENQLINGVNVDSVSSSTSFIYQYRNGVFKQISSESYTATGP